MFIRNHPATYVRTYIYAYSGTRHKDILRVNFVGCDNHQTVLYIINNAHHYIIYRIIQLQYMTSPLQDQRLQYYII